jgi:pilus assembly protein FimV
MTMRKWSALFVQGSIKKPVVSFITHFKLVLVASVLAISALASMPSAYAVGLGEVRVNSSLNEPLAASIQIIKADDLQDNQLLVSLASPEAFERAGVSRDFFLSRLQFSVGRDSSNQRVINVVTDQPVVEPYLDFLVQLQWP